MSNGKRLSQQNDTFKDCKLIHRQPKAKNRKFGVDEFKYMPIFFWNFYLSKKCTRRCPQCYTGSSPVSDMEMSDEMFGRLLDFIIELYEKSDIAIHQLTYMGGEPLLRTDRIKAINDIVSEKTAGMVSVVITNGDLLDVVNWNDLGKVAVWGMNITDLPLTEIGRRIGVIRKNNLSRSHTLFATLDYENLEIKDRMEEVVVYGLENDCRFRFTINTYKGNDEEYKKKVLAKLHSIIDVCERYHAKGYEIPTSYILDRIVPHHWDKIEVPYEHFTPYSCGRRVISVKVDGNVSPCLRNHDIAVASIYDDAGEVLRRLKVPEFEYSYANKFIDKECMSCDVRYVCQGGCPLTRLLAYGKIDGKFPLCQIHKEIIPRLMAITKETRWKDKT